ncbi:MAG TPA: hypothetical protein VFQ22_06625 [Longimicrobiales bacterium]|nr:hypothetical protein [Longimicrobiales bacterium]
MSEAVLALWLVASAFLLARPEETGTTLVPLLAGAAVLAVEGLARRHALAHFRVVGVAVLLAGWGWASYPRPGPPAAQNAIVSGLLLALFGVVPSRASDPPPAWRPHVDRD